MLNLFPRSLFEAAAALNIGRGRRGPLAIRALETCGRCAQDGTFSYLLFEAEQKLFIRSGIGLEKPSFLGAVMGSRPIVLVVEDESFLRRHAVEMIEDAGYEVLEAASADEAIHILETTANIRIIFTDVQMPGSMDGLKLAHAVRGRWPPIKIVVTSGQFDIPPEDLPSGGQFFRKPYNQTELIHALDELSG